MYEIVNGPGVKTLISESGMLDIIIDSDKAPFHPPGYIVYEMVNTEKQPKLETHKIIFHLDDGISKSGSMVRLSTNHIFNTFTINNQKYSITLNRNELERIGSIQIETNSDEWSFNEVNNNLFEVGNRILNNISVQYSIPLYFSSFVVLHKDLSHFTFIDKKSIVEDFVGMVLEPPTNLGYWSHTTESFRRAINSIDPIVKYLYFYIAIESLRVCIKYELGYVNPYVEGEIQNKNYSEPIFYGTSSINNSPERLNLKQDEKIYSILFNKDSDFRKLRNLAAHTISKYDGTFKLTSNLNDYLDYSYGLVYLNKFYSIFLEDLVNLTNK